MEINGLTLLLLYPIVLTVIDFTLMHGRGKRRLLSTFLYGLLLQLFLITLLLQIVWLTIADIYLTLIWFFLVGMSFSKGSEGRLIRYRNIAISLTLIIFFTILIASATWYQQLATAKYFDNMIIYKSGDIFRNPIKDENVRLVTSYLARIMTEQRISEFGSNVQVLSTHISRYNGRLVWISTIASTNVMAENYIKGFVIIDANDPTKEPIIVHKTFPIGEGLFLDRDIAFRSYMYKSAWYLYGVAYPLFENGKITYVQTRSVIGFDLVKRFAQPLKYDENLNIIEEDYYTQYYDESTLEDLITTWGDLRRGDGFDLLSGGFLWIIPPSRDRVEISEDVRYIVDPDTNEFVAMVMVNPVENPKTLAGLFKVYKDRIEFYDLRDFNLISGVTAGEVVTGRLPKPATGIYYATMPLLYPERIGEEVKLVWYVPIYWEGAEIVRLAGLGMVDAENIDNVVILMAGEGVKGAELVSMCRTRFRSLVLGRSIEAINVTARVLDVINYVEAGETVVVLHIDSPDYEWCKVVRSNLKPEGWYLALTLKEGEEVVLTLKRVEDEWIVTALSRP